MECKHVYQLKKHALITSWVLLLLLPPGIVARPASTTTSQVTPTAKQCNDDLLENQLKDCLVPFEQKLIVYRDEGTTNEVRRDMVAEFCRKYEETLQCMHLLFLDCPPGPRHYQLIAIRLGYLRDYMNSVCTVPLEDMTPPPITSTTTTSSTAISSTSTTASTTTIKPSTSTIAAEAEHIIHRKYPSSTGKDNLTPSPIDSSKSNSLFNRKSNINIPRGGQASELDIKHNLDIQLNEDDVSQNEIQQDYIAPATGDFDSNVIPALGCSTQGGSTNKRCAMALTATQQSSAQTTQLPLTLVIICSILASIT